MRRIREEEDQDTCDCGGDLQYKGQDEDNHSLRKCVKCNEIWYDETEL